MKLKNILFTLLLFSSALLAQETQPEFTIQEDGLAITFTGMLVVFSSLILLFIVFSNLSRLLNISFKKRPKDVLAETKKKEDLTGEVSAAIAAALHLYSKDIHDEENTVLTIKKVSRTYSPWSSKIYGLRQNPR